MRLRHALLRGVDAGLSWFEILHINNISAMGLSLDRVPTLVIFAKRNVHFGSVLCKMRGLNRRECRSFICVLCTDTSTVEFISSWCRIHGLFVFGAADVLSIHLKPHNFIRSYDQVFV
ncbi:hypothetical protein HanOQP8_Chr05g0179901 [Helianthus annuus]|nr:hypothetical protein HanOQP8_Chr05g0179901 [Helianthus annuus]